MLWIGEREKLHKSQQAERFPGGTGQALLCVSEGRRGAGRVRGKLQAEGAGAGAKRPSPTRQYQGARRQQRIGRRHLHAALVLLLIASLCAFGLTGCGGSGGSSGSGGSDKVGGGGTPGSYEVPAFRDASYDSGAAQGNGAASIDVSSVEDGYVAVSGHASSRLKFQVMKGEDTYNYDIDSDGTPSVFPLQSGDGLYTFRVMENVMDSKYAELYSTSVNVALEDPFEPFLRPSDYVDYDQDSACVQKAAEIAAQAGSAMDVVAGVYDYICDNVTYDQDKAATVQSDYTPDPDETLQTGKGICFDYAALAAAMLRSQGIPTKMIFGYVAPDNLYHAWNMFYTQETGWVTVDIQASPGDWNRIDLTFAANGADSDFIGDGSHYSDVYTY